MEVKTSQKSLKNWKLCALCEEDTVEKLICPFNATGKRENYGSGYKTLAENLAKFRGIGHCPTKISLERLDEGNGFEVTLKNNKASWHKYCFN